MKRIASLKSPLVFIVPGIFLMMIGQGYSQDIPFGLGLVTALIGVVWLYKMPRPRFRWNDHGHVESDQHHGGVWFDGASDGGGGDGGGGD